MKTVDIIKGLLEISPEWTWDSEAVEFRCQACENYKDEGHTTDCKWVKYTQAATQYLRLMEGSKK